MPYILDSSPQFAVLSGVFGLAVFVFTLAMIVSWPFAACELITKNTDEQDLRKNNLNYFVYFVSIFSIASIVLTLFAFGNENAFSLFFLICYIFSAIIIIITYSRSVDRLSNSYLKKGYSLFEAFFSLFFFPFGIYFARARMISLKELGALRLRSAD